jgi:hypothetical protein
MEGGTMIRPAERMTSGQRDFLKDLIENRQMPDDDREWLRARLNDNDVTKMMASKMISQLKDRPKVAKNGVPADGTIDYRDIGGTKPVGFVVINGTPIPRGSYGVITPDATNQTSFYRLWIGEHEDPTFHGRMSMSQLVGPDKFKLSPQQRGRILRMIADQGPAECATRYGLEIGKCGICGLRLTNDESRRIGIGPVCRANWGW